MTKQRNKNWHVLLHCCWLEHSRISLRHTFTERIISGRIYILKLIIQNELLNYTMEANKSIKNKIIKSNTLVITNEHLASL